MIVTNRFDPDVRVLKEAKYLVSKGMSVKILCWDREGHYKNKEYEEIDGIKIKRFYPFAKYGTGVKQLLAYIKFILQCKNYLKNQGYNYLHSHDLDGVIVGYLIKNKKSKLIFDMHEFYEVQGKKQHVRYLIRLIVNFFQNKSHSIIYVNENQLSVMTKKNKSKATFIPNYPAKSDYEYKKQRSDLLRISYIGAVRQYEQLLNLLEACKNLNKVKVCIHGGGIAYKKLIEKKSFYRNAEITGVFHYNNISKLYSEADILYALYPMNTLQNRIAFPVKFFEALITKTPIIVSKGSILEDFVLKSDIGFVVDGNSQKEIKKLIEYINNNRNVLCLKRKNIEKIQYKYTWEKVVGELDKIYKG